VVIEIVSSKHRDLCTCSKNDIVSSVENIIVFGDRVRVQSRSHFSVAELNAVTEPCTESLIPSYSVTTLHKALIWFTEHTLK